MTSNAALGPLMLDVEGLTLSEEDRQLLREPEVGGLILFTRNFHSLSQLRELTAAMRTERPNLLIAVDHEGGRVQRFRTEFTRLPAMGRLGEEWRKDRESAQAQAFSCGWLLAAELLAVGIDFSFAPVLDREYGRSRVIGDRAFGTEVDQIVALAGALIAGMNDAGMAATGKHFPGHGYPVADSHVDIPRDERTAETIIQQDMSIFASLIRQQKLGGVMPAHVIYEQVDPSPAGFSQYWLQDVLRTQLGFDGVIFSDDLSMEGAGVAGTYPERATAALEAGCDMVLACNNRRGAKEVLHNLQRQQPAPNDRLARMQGQGRYDWESLHASDEWAQHQDVVARLMAAV